MRNAHQTVERFTLMLTLVIVGALAVVGCGNSGDGGGATGTSAEANIPAAKKLVDKMYKGTYRKPAGPVIKPEAGKDIWMVSAGQSIEATVTEAAAIKEAGALLGWNVTVYDGQFNPNRWLDGVEQAISAGADGVILLYVDCPPVRAALKRAQAQGVMVVGSESSDCADLKQGDEKLFNWTVQYQGHEPFHEWIADGASAQANWVIAETDGKADVILPTEYDTSVARLQSDTYKKVLDECGGCDYTEVRYAASDYGPTLQQKIEQALIESPNANSFISIIDAVLTTGGAQALEASGRAEDMSIMAGEGSSAGIDLIYEGLADACIGVPTDWEGYASVDALARLFAGRDPGEVDTGIGLQICTRKHNLPPRGEAFQAPVDYKSAYEQLWSTD